MQTFFEKSESESWDQEYLAGRASWDVGLPDTNISELVKSGELPVGTLLDLGCGPGNESIHLAKQGFRTTGIDISPIAIQRAREKAAKEHVDCCFIVADILRIPLQKERFDVILDKACFHFIAPHERRKYTDKIVVSLAPGGKYLLFVSSDHDVQIDGPHKFTREDIIATFGDTFNILWVRLVTLEHHRLKPRPYFCLMEHLP